MLAVMGHAAPAGRTGSAVTVGIHAHPVARPIIHHRFADLLHDAGELMPQYGGRGDLRRVPQTPQAFTRISTSFGPTAGISCSSILKSCFP